jgi:hypothetical protein
MHQNLRPSDLFRCLAAGLALALGCAAMGEAAQPADPGSLCESAARHAASVTGVPLDLLRAIMLTETGIVRGGNRTAWPWATNTAGAGAWHADRAAARTHIERTLAEGGRNIDIGCFQMNYHWHAHRFANLEAMLDPFENAVQAARFLTELQAEFGDWARAAGAYHSRDPDRAATYRAIVEANRAHPDPGDPPAAPEAGLATAHLSRGYPLLVPGTPRGGASLVPDDTGGAPLLVAARRPLYEGW